MLAEDSEKQIPGSSSVADRKERLFSISKLVRIRSDNDKNYPLFKYTVHEQNVEDSISIPIHPDNVMFHEWHYLHSHSAQKLSFCFVGTNVETGETCHDFSYYHKVTSASFTHQFSSVQSIFQIASQLPSCQEIKILLDQNNIVKTESDEKFDSSPTSYLCSTVKHLEIKILKWHDKNPHISKLTYNQLRLDSILYLTSGCCPSLEYIRVYFEGSKDNSTSCTVMLSAFRERLYSIFEDRVRVTWGPLKKLALNVNARETAKVKIQRVEANLNLPKPVNVYASPDPGEAILSPSINGIPVTPTGPVENSQSSEASSAFGGIEDLGSMLFKTEPVDQPSPSPSSTISPPLPEPKVDEQDIEQFIIGNSEEFPSDRSANGRQSRGVSPPLPSCFRIDYNSLPHTSSPPRFGSSSRSNNDSGKRFESFNNFRGQYRALRKSRFTNMAHGRNRFHYQNNYQNYNHRRDWRLGGEGPDTDYRSRVMDDRERDARMRNNNNNTSNRGHREQYAPDPRLHRHNNSSGYKSS